MKRVENYWKSDASRSYHEDECYKVDLYRKFVDFIESYNPKTLLDYGCGNGYIDTLLDSRIQKTLYDINPFSIKIDQLAKYNCKIVSDLSSLPNDHFDVVLLNFVLVCVPDEKTYSEILSAVKYLKKEDGELIIFDCHPCFMQYSYSYFRAEISKNFQYLSYGEPFIKHINAIDHETGEKVQCTFNDFHWPLSFIINKLVECGFNIIRMKEWPDDGFAKYNEAKNELYPPIYSLVCK